MVTAVYSVFTPHFNAKLRLQGTLALKLPALEDYKVKEQRQKIRLVKPLKEKVIRHMITWYLILSKSLASSISSLQ